MTTFEEEVRAWLNSPDVTPIDDDVAEQVVTAATHAVAASSPEPAPEDVGPSEAEVQEAVVEWAAYQANAEPELELLHAIPNGGHRIKAVAARLKAQGVKAGYPDLGLDVPRGEYHGLRIELKVGRNRPTKEQEWWLRRLNEQGYCARVCYGFDAARVTIEWYLSL